MTKQSVISLKPPHDDEFGPLTAGRSCDRAVGPDSGLSHRLIATIQSAPNAGTATSCSTSKRQKPIFSSQTNSSTHESSLSCFFTRTINLGFGLSRQEFSINKSNNHPLLQGRQRRRIMHVRLNHSIGPFRRIVTFSTLAPQIGVRGSTSSLALQQSIAGGASQSAGCDYSGLGDT